MDQKQSFEKIMSETVNMALATSVESRPNVRVVTFAYDTAKAGRLFFTSFKGNQKTREFEQNATVCCMPLPENPEIAVQVRIFGEVKKSDLSLEDVIALIGKKNPDHGATLKKGGNMLDVYEVCFSEAMVTIGMSDAEIIRIQ